MKTYYKVTCELYTEHVVPVLTAKQYDSGRGVDITLTDCGAVVVPDPGDVLNLYCKKPDGTVSYISGTLTDDKVRVDFTNVLLAAPGIVECELEINDGADTLSTPVFKMVVLPSNFNAQAIQSQDEFTALETALQTVSGYDGRIIALETTASGLGAASTYGVLNALTQATAGENVLDAAQGKVLNDSMVKLFTGAAGIWMGKLSTANSLGFYSAAYPSGANLLGTISLGLGTIISDTLTTATSCGNSDFLNAATIAHEAATYVVFGYVSFASNASGVRSMFITSSSTGSSAIVTSARARVAPVSGYETTFGCAGIIKATAAGSWYLRAWQNSGAALNVTGAQLTAIKIAD